MTNILLPQNPNEDDLVSIPDGRKFIRKNGAWRQKTGVVAYQTPSGPGAQPGIFDRYDLKNKVTTGELDLAVSQVFFLDNRDGSQTTNLYFSNAPTDRSMVVVLDIKGMAGTVNFPGGVTWNTTPPTLTSGRVTAIFYWNGESYIGAIGPVANPQF